MVKVLTLFILMGLSFNIKAQDAGYNIQYYTTKDGLSQSQVTGILRDDNGFMWFSTWLGGLNKFDGFQFTQYQPLQNDSNCVSSPSIECIFKDSKGLIWIGTKNHGLNLYNPVTEKFKNFNIKKLIFHWKQRPSS